MKHGCLPRPWLALSSAAAAQAPDSALRQRCADPRHAPGADVVAGLEPLRNAAARDDDRRWSDLSDRAHSARHLAQGRHCDFPPLRVELDQARTRRIAVRAPAAAEARHPSASATPGFQQKVLLEYAAYRLYNLMSPLSFRARLANIDYLDDERPALHFARRLFRRGRRATSPSATDDQGAHGRARSVSADRSRFRRARTPCSKT